MQKHGSRIVMVHHITGLVFGLVGFVGIYCALNFSAYVTADMEVKHVLKGKHISNFVHEDSGENIDFVNYMLCGIGNRQTSFLIKAGKALA